MEQESDIYRWLVPPKRFSAAVVMTLLMQAAGALVWATHLEARVGSMEQQSVNAAMLNEKFARLDERLEYLKLELEGMHQQVGQINNRLMKAH